MVVNPSPQKAVFSYTAASQPSSPESSPSDAVLPTAIAEDGQPGTSSSQVWLPYHFDIGDITRGALDDDTKANILTSVLVPRAPFKYPLSDYGNQKRGFQEKWITKDGYGFLAYSKKLDGVFCKPCLLFFHEGVGKGGHQNPGKLVTSCCRDWKKAKDIFKSYAKTEYHKNCVALADNFVRVIRGKKQDILSSVDSARAREIQENRAAIRPIIETILFCAEEELPLRGKNDSGPLSLEKPKSKDGKLRALLRFRANSGDNALKNHVINSPRNATYVSPAIQNEILQVCSGIVEQQLATKINKASCFSILADETMDVSGTEQLSMCIRYVDNEAPEGPILREDFVGFIPIYDQGAENVSKVILRRCADLNLDLRKCVGQGYDGAAVMSGRLHGVQARIRELYPMARYVHCASHRLNLVLSNSLEIPMIRNCLGIVNEAINLFRNHPRANKILKDAIPVHVPESRKKRLIRLCETRFVERQDSVITFVELLKAISVSTEEISQQSWQISSKAASLYAAIEKSEFLISLLVCNKLFAITVNLSTSLQEKSLDLVAALSHVESVLDTFKTLRENATESFHEIFLSASKLAKEVFQSEIRKPRVTSKQTTRANPPTDSVEEYYRVATFIPCVDTIIQSLTDKFTSNEDVIPGLQVLLPRFASPSNAVQLETLLPYFDDEEGPSPAVLKAEYELWCKTTATMDPKSEILQVLSSAMRRTSQI